MRLSIFVVLAFFSVLTAANAATVSLSGNFAGDDPVQLFRVIVSNPAKVVSIKTTSSSGGGFDPMLTLFDSNGLFLDFNDDDFDLFGGRDSKLTNLLDPGTYTVALSQFSNSPIGNLVDGFSKSGQTNYTNVYGCTNGLFCSTIGDNMTSHWNLEFDGARSVERITSVSSIPLPATLPLFGAGVVALMFFRKKTRK